MKCSGRNAITGERIEVEFDSAIQHVDPVLGSESDQNYIAPGFIDLQVNGFAGADFNSPATSHEEIERAIKAIVSTGVTRFFPTVITGSPENMMGALRNLAIAKETLALGHVMEAFHIEGPYISAEDGPRGAHPREWVRPPNLEEFRRFQDAAQGNIRLVTLAPEWPEALEYIEQLIREGIIVSIGHTRASAERIREAAAAGATMSTHLGNGAGSATHRDDFIEEQLADSRLAASFIVDGHHLPHDFLQRALNIKGLDRSILITDAVAPAMCRPGPYQLGGVEVTLHDDDRVTLRNGTRLAGSVLRMDRAISNLMTRAGVTLSQAITMATINPARVGRVAGRLRGIRPGDRADVVRFRFINNKVEILETIGSGKPLL